MAAEANASCMTIQPGHGDEVRHRGQDHEHVEDLVEAERARPRVRAAEREDDRADGVEHAAGGDQDHRRQRQRLRQLREADHRDPAERDVGRAQTAPAAR